MMARRGRRLKAPSHSADDKDPRPKKTMKLRLKSRLRLLSFGPHYLRLQGYLSIDGWLTVDEAVTLYDLARAVPTGGHVVEIGSWQGKSAVVLGKGLEGRGLDGKGLDSNGGARLHCVDPFNADGCAPSLPLFAAQRAQHTCSLRAGFERNLARHRLRQRVEIWQGYSHEIAPRFPHAIDLLFIDGNHDYEAVRQDFALWAPKLAEGGVICLHDACDKFPGVKQLIAEEIDGKGDFAEQRCVDSLYVARRTRAYVPV